MTKDITKDIEIRLPGSVVFDPLQFALSRNYELIQINQSLHATITRLDLKQATATVKCNDALEKMKDLRKIIKQLKKELNEKQS